MPPLRPPSTPFWLGHRASIQRQLDVYKSGWRCLGARLMPLRTSPVGFPVLGIASLGGGMGEEEEPPVAARRELREELGIEAADWTGLGHFDLDTSTVYCPVHLFVARRLSFTETEPDGTERIERLRLSF